jgi:hypothetical protein
MLRGGKESVAIESDQPGQRQPVCCGDSMGVDVQVGS